MFNDHLVKEFQNKETPFYYYNISLLEDTLQTAKKEADKHGFHVHYALKANFNDRVLKSICDVGFGADCVSGNEVLKAVEIGFDASKIVFAGVGKSDKEIIAALDNDIFAFNVESIQELGVINELAQARGKKARIALRINPNVDAQTHHYITTGLEENKFGIKIWELDSCIKELKALNNIELIGIHFHVGSQITDLNVFKSLCVKINELNTWFEERDYYLKVLNVGGGLGVDYHNPDQNSISDFEAYFNIFDQFLDRRKDQEVHFELGRALVAQCGSLISRVLYVKTGLKKNFLILDAGMTELMRPALYQAYHKIEKLEIKDSQTNESVTANYDIVGPICESTDCFAKEVVLPETSRNDLMAIRTAGAYGEVMASRYNLREEIRYVYSDEI
ncbi:diaminopimelate decarboxylase [Albibacterium sp.]|uniref:diaminopimelate decarboxylase n=1 Tax=Albibacterium sp. TaxID=2952885 RepID=UPI002C0F91DC|nr:diaminopimelate decarboxylase [Albibacterium sp.]HUH18806.1 diaminopimelate decarboxylase [Albibacterium sp.]